MDEKLRRKAEAITRMLNGFPQTTDENLLLLDSYMQLLESHSTDAVERAARRFLSGDVPHQHSTFPPSVAEFIQEVRSSEDYLAALGKPRIAPPVRRDSGPAPFEVASERARAKYAGRVVLHTDISLESWLTLSKSKQVPVGAVWSAALGTVFGPAPSSA